MKTKTILFVLSALCLAVSCTKDSPKDDPKQEIYDGHFECIGVAYETLQAAIDACVASGESQEINLVGNVKDDGALIPDGIGDCFILNLSAFRYVLNDGKCLNVGNNCAVLQASGGGIEGNGVIIKSTGEDLSFSDNIAIKGDISASSDVCFGQNFLGKFEGSLSLDGGTAYFGSEHADIHIINLSTKGSDAVVHVCNAPKGGILIDNVASDLKHPVCAMKEGLVEIKSGAAPHVHKFTKSDEVAGNCCTRSHYIMSCPDCGYEYEEFSEDEDAYGPCNPETLVHEDALAATATEFGNSERWICPFCGKAYADKDGKTLLDCDGLLLPTSLLLDHDVLNYFGNAMDDLFTPANDGGVILGIILAVVGIIETAGFSIPSLLSNPKFEDLNAKLDVMNAKLDEINLKLNAVITLINAKDAKDAINARHRNLLFLSAYTPMVFNNISNIIKSSSSNEAKIQEIKKVLTWWSNQQDKSGGKIGSITEALLREYRNINVYGPTSIPKCNEVAANTVFLWEHDSYEFRNMCNVKDLLITCCSAILDLLYVSDIKEYPNEDLRKADFAGIKNDIKLYTDELKRDIARMDSRKDLRRLNLSFNIEFSNKIRWCYPLGWFAYHWQNTSYCRLPRYTSCAEVSKKTCNIVKNEKMFGMPFSVEMAKKIYAYYSRDGKKDLDIKKVLVDSAKFTPVNGPLYIQAYYHSHSYIIADNKDEVFGHFNDSNCYPYYNIFYWYTKPLLGTSSYLGFRTCLDKHANPQQRMLLPQCGIKANESGYFQWLGPHTDIGLWTLELANN